MTYTDEGLREKTPAEKAAGTGKEGGDSKEYGFSIGGPIIKDKMHFFLTYEAKEFTTPNTVQAPQLFDDNNQELDWVGALTPELRENYGPVANPFDEELFFAKLDWELGYSDRLELSGKSREETQQSGAAGVVAESAASTYVNDDDRLALRWEHSGERYFNEATVTYEDTHDSPSKEGNEPGKAYRALGTALRGFRHHPADRRRRSAQLLLRDAERLLPPGTTSRSPTWMATTRSRPASSSRTSSWRCATPRPKRSMRSSSIPPSPMTASRRIPSR